MDFLANYFGSLNPMSFLSALPGNIAQGIIWGLMGLGVFLTFKLLNFADLSVDGSFATGGAVTAVMLINGCPVWATIIVAILAGLAAGLVTGLLHTLLGIPDILAGILTQIALYSINLNIMGKSNLPISYRNYTLVVSASNINMAILVGLGICAVVIAAMYWYFGTEQGSTIRSTGSNPAMSKAQGININFTKVIALALSNGLVALSGSLFAQYQGFADINMGRGAIVIGLAAVIIGEVHHQNALCNCRRYSLLYRNGHCTLAQNADRRYKALHGNYRCNLPCSSVSPKKEKDFIQESCKNEC